MYDDAGVGSVSLAIGVSRAYLSERDQILQWYHQAYTVETLTSFRPSLTCVYDLQGFARYQLITSSCIPELSMVADIEIGKHEQSGRLCFPSVGRAKLSSGLALLTTKDFVVLGSAC
jgi:hypothetical protein